MRTLIKTATALSAGLTPAGWAQHLHADMASVPPQGVVLPGLDPGCVLIEGDIQVRMDQYLAMRAGMEAVFGQVNFWPGGVVPYWFVETGPFAVSATNRGIMVNAMQQIELQTGVDFVPYKAGVHSDVLRVQSHPTVNSSPVGLVGGFQTVNIMSWGTPIIIIHELYHSLGFWHEQSRWDRDTYVTINANNICGAPGCPAGTGAGQCCSCLDGAGACVPCAFNFAIQGGATVYGPYDFDSFMHYRRNEFSCNTLDTITVNPPWNAQWQSVIGQRERFSHLDAVTCRGIYPRSGDRWLNPAVPHSAPGTFFQPWNQPVFVAYFGTPANGTLFIQPGAYAGVGTYSLPRSITAPLGGVTIGN